MIITAPQRRFLYRIQAAGTLKQNARAAKMIKALESAGLITVDLEVRTSGMGRHSFLYTLTPRRCKHGRLLSPNPQPNPACDICEIEWFNAREKTRCPTCGKLK